MGFLDVHVVVVVALVLLVLLLPHLLLFLLLLYITKGPLACDCISKVDVEKGIRKFPQHPFVVLRRNQKELGIRQKEARAGKGKGKAKMLVPRSYCISGEWNRCGRHNIWMYGSAPIGLVILGGVVVAAVFVWWLECLVLWLLLLFFGREALISIEF